MARPRKAVEFQLEIVYVPIPEEHIVAWRAGVSLLLKFMLSNQIIQTTSGDDEDTSSLL